MRKLSLESVCVFLQAIEAKAEAVAKQHGLKLIQVNLSEEDKEGLTYLKFTRLVRPDIAEANPGTAHTKINALLGALWKDYKKQKEAEGSSGRRKTPKHHKASSSKGSAKKKKKEKEKAKTKSSKGSKPVVSIRRATKSSKSQQFIWFTVMTVYHTVQ